MEQQDFLMRQIDQLSRVLAKLLADLVGPSKGQVSESIEVTNQTLKTEIDLNIEELMTIPEDKFIETLRSKRQLSNNDLDAIAHIFYSLGEMQQDAEQKYKLQQLALTIYDYLDFNNTTYSLDRHLKMKQIRNAIITKR
jgi:hypothetical protein